MKIFSRCIPLLLILGAFAQEVPPFGVTVDVRLVNVDVVVRDRQGKLVHGLTANDFTVYENGNAQAITNFAGYGSERVQSAPAEPQSVPTPKSPEPRQLLLFADRLNLRDTISRGEFFRGLRGFLERAMREGDEAALFYWGTSLKVLTPMTADRAVIMDAVKRLEEESKLQIDPTDMERSDLNMRKLMLTQEVDKPTVTDAIKEDRRKAAQRAFDLQQRKIDAINYVIQSCAGLPGRKVMILMTDRLSKTPGLEYGYGELGVVYENPGDDVSFGREFNGEFNARRQLDSVVRNANASGVTVYGFFPKGLDRTQPTAEATESQRNVSYQMLKDQADAIESIAMRTGGTTALGGKLSGEALGEMAEDLENYYSLAYRPADSRTDRTRKITVTVNRPDVIVQARNAVVDKSDDAIMRDRVISRLLYGGAQSAIGVRVKQRGVERQGNGRVVVSVDISVPIGQLQTIPVGSGHDGKFRVLTAAANADGDVSDVAEKEQAFHIPEGQLQRASAGVFTYHLKIEVRATSNRILIAVVDDLDKDTGFAELPLTTMQRSGHFEELPKGPATKPAWARP